MPVRNDHVLLLCLRYGNSAHQEVFPLMTSGHGLLWANLAPLLLHARNSLGNGDQYPYNNHGRQINSQ
jgi:hypothetical protein